MESGNFPVPGQNTFRSPDVIDDFGIHVLRNRSAWHSGFRLHGIITFFSGFGFVLGATTWARLSEKPPVNFSGPKPDGKMESN